MVLATYLPTTIPHPVLFAVVAAASAIASGLKLRLPLGTTGASNLSVSYTIDFASLLLLGPAPTMLVAALSAWAQSTTKIARQNPAYRTLFNIAALVITVYAAAGWVFTILGGQVGTLTVGVLKALVAAALVYYLLNTSIVATAVGLSTNQPVWRVWQSNFLWTAPSYFVGAGAAAAAAGAWTAGYGWLIPLAAAPVYLTFRSYRIYLERITRRAATPRGDASAAHPDGGGAQRRSRLGTALRALSRGVQRWALGLGSEERRILCV